MTTIGRLAVKISADASGLNSGLRDAGKSVSDFDAQATALGDKLKGFLAPAAVAAGMAFAGKMLKNVADTADALAKLSQKTGVAVEDLSRLQYAAGMAGVSNDQLSAGITRLSRGMSEASQGTGEAAKAFDAMGLSVTNADGTLKNQRQMLEEIADRFSKYEDGAQKSALAQQIFGRSGAELIPLLNSGAQGLRDMADESDALGNTMSTSAALAAEQFNDNLTRLQTQLGGVGVTIGSALMPTLMQMSAEFVNGVRGANGMSGAAENLRKFLVGLNNAALGVVTSFKLAGTAIGGTAAAIGAILSGQFGEARNIINLLKQDLSDIALASAQSMSRVANAVAPTPASGADRTAAPMLSAPAAPAAGRAAGRSGGVADNSKALEAAAERERAYWSDRVEKISESLMTEQELLEKKHAADLARLDAAQMAEDEKRAIREALVFEHLEKIGEIEEQAQQIRIEAEEKAAAEIERIRLASMSNLERFTAMSYRDQAAHVAKAMHQQLTSVTTNSRAMFNIQKAANISEAIMNTYAGATRALKDYPAPWSFGVAAATVAAGLARVASIKSQSFGGSGGGGGGGGVAATNGMAPQQPGGGQTITVQGIGAGDLFSGDSVRVLIDRLIDAQRNGARIVLT
jgi:hypothetical protein